MSDTRSNCIDENVINDIVTNLTHEQLFAAINFAKYNYISVGEGTYGQVCSAAITLFTVGVGLVPLMTQSKEENIWGCHTSLYRQSRINNRLNEIYKKNENVGENSYKNIFTDILYGKMGTDRSSFIFFLCLNLYNRASSKNRLLVENDQDAHDLVNAFRMQASNQYKVEVDIQVKHTERRLSL